MADSRPDEPADPYAEEYGEPDVEEEPFPEYSEPSMEDLTAGLPDASEVDPAFQRAFWGLVLTINIGLFVLVLGLLLVGFRGQYREGGAAAALGVLVLLYAVHNYRAIRREHFSDGSDGS